MKNIKSILFFAAFLGASCAIAQPNINDQTQDVIKNFDARLIESEKVKITPVLPNIDTSTKAQTYTIPNKVLGVDYQPPRLRPIGIPPQKLPPQYNGFFKGGYGFPSTPYLEGSYRIGDPSRYLASIKAKYHAMNSKALDNQRFALANVEANGTFFAQAGLAVDGKLGFTNDNRWYYGSRVPETKDAAKQFFNTLYAGAKVYNSVRTVADFNYSLGLNFYNLNDNFGSKETDFNINLNGTKWFNEKHPLSLTLRTEFTSFDSTGGKKQSLNNIYLQPNFTFKGDNFSVRLGANLISHEDNFYPLPDIEGQYNLAGNQLGIYAGWKGDFTKNTYRNLTNYNPFIFNQARIENTRKTEYYGGVKGGLGYLDYSAQAGFSTNVDLPLFLADTADRFRRFRVIYDSVNIVNVRGAVTIRPMKDLEVTGTISQNIYDTKREKRAWGLPSTDINVAAKYLAYNKGTTTAMAKAALFVQNGVNYIDAKGEASRLNPLFDISIGGELWFSKNVGAFLDLNNILNLKRERWLNYPTVGLNVLGGITARF